MRHLYKNHGSVPSDKGKGSVCVLAIEALIGNKICLHQVFLCHTEREKKKLLGTLGLLFPYLLKLGIS